VNFKHLHYFWVVARAGGVVRAGEQLHTTPQTLSSQIKLLEERLGRKLFRKAGRNLELTEDGRVALTYADEIFGLGRELEQAMREKRDSKRVLEFRVGVADSVIKTMAYRLIEPALAIDEPVHLICSEGKFPDLLGRLALQQFDIVIADAPLPSRSSVRAFNHPLGSSSVSFFAAPALLRKLRGRFPRNLDGAPMLVPGLASDLRVQFDAWLTRHRLLPQVIAEFDDGALMKSFGREGRGVFMGPSALATDIQTQYGVQLLGSTDELQEEFYAISLERRIRHPCVSAITNSARGALPQRKDSALEPGGGVAPG
jgi:LysR family transcriptional regulator, transcriptional activator of nhaA